MILRISRWIVILELLCPIPGFAFNASLWVQEFYQTQDLKSFESAIAVWRARETLEDADMRQPIVGFLSHLFAKYPQTIEVAIGDVSELTEGERETFGMALHRSGTDSARAALNKLGLKKLLTSPAPSSLAETEIIEASGLDLCWGYFFASGDTEVLRPIVHVLVNGKYASSMDAYRLAREKEDDAAIAKHRENAFRFALYEAARWSLAANAKRHPAVNQFLEEFAKNNNNNPEELVQNVAAILKEQNEVPEALQ